jgi:hypothetical protein
MKRFSTIWLTGRILSLVELIMPNERKQWARAMKAEAAHVESDAAALTFAGGCLWAAIIQHLEVEANRSAAVLSAGLTAGFMFFAHAAINGSGAWPLLWPLLGGVMTAVLCLKDRGLLKVRRGAWLGLRAGLLAGLLFAIGGATLVWASDSLTLDSRLHVLGMGAIAGAALSAVGAGTATLLSRFV